ncbi:hypothetical protein RRG08_046663 [Elysia crispata]|uniref:Uncharacterized protein n=1 Tax=Elysia crispata TaxID=231223 RepID=A0AAE1BBY0_9GAST|nr:hypothetical protein RRG08_046663 [Elysia crispata]
MAEDSVRLIRVTESLSTIIVEFCQQAEMAVLLNERVYCRGFRSSSACQSDAVNNRFLFNCSALSKSWSGSTIGVVNSVQQSKSSFGVDGQWDSTTGSGSVRQSGSCGRGGVLVNLSGVAV